jgi:hypothetical protein
VKRPEHLGIMTAIERWRSEFGEIMAVFSGGVLCLLLEALCLLFGRGIASGWSEKLGRGSCYSVLFSVVSFLPVSSTYFMIFPEWIGNGSRKLSVMVLYDS